MRKIFTLLMVLVMLPLVVWGQEEETPIQADRNSDEASSPTDYQWNDDNTVCTLNTKLGLWWFANSSDSFEGKTVELSTENAEGWDMSDYEWPVKSSDGTVVLKGTFEGNNQMVTIKATPEGEKNRWGYTFGFIGYVEGGTIQNLTVKADVSTNVTNRGAGIVVGHMDGGLVQNVVSEGTFTNTGNMNGGIVGQIEGDVSIINCINKAAISTTDLKSCGIVGDSSGNLSIINCGNFGKMSGDDSAGLVFCDGSNANVSIYNSFNLGEIEYSYNPLVGTYGTATPEPQIEHCFYKDDGEVDESEYVEFLNEGVWSYSGTLPDGVTLRGWTNNESDQSPEFGLLAPQVTWPESPVNPNAEISIQVKTPSGAIAEYSVDGGSTWIAVSEGEITLVIPDETTISVRAKYDDNTYSDVVSRTFAVKPIPNAPTISGATPFEENVTVTITAQEEGADIYYTTDGTVPTQITGTKYEGPFTLTTSAMVKAVAILDDVPSSIAEKEFKRIPTVPVISTESTTFDESITVTITAEEDAAIYYTTDGSDPTSSSELYNEPLTFTETTTLKVIAVIDGVPSEVVTVVLTKNEPDPEEPETPDTPVTPDYPDYYNIYVEECEGVTVETSTNVVREGNSMSFTIEVAEGYTAEDMVVKVKRSLFGYTDVIEPNEEGKYEIRNIYTEIYITVEGVEKETPTGIEELQSTKVYAQDGSLYVQTPKQEEVRIISISGAVAKNETQIGLKRYDLPRGIYIVRVGEETYKVRN